MMIHLQSLVLQIEAMLLSFEILLIGLCSVAMRSCVIQITDQLSSRFFLHQIERCPARANSTPRICQQLEALTKSRVSQVSTKVMWSLVQDDMCFKQFEAQISSANEPATAVSMMWHDRNKFTIPLELRT